MQLVIISLFISCTEHKHSCVTLISTLTLNLIFIINVEISTVVFTFG